MITILSKVLRHSILLVLSVLFLSSCHAKEKNASNAQSTGGDKILGAPKDSDFDWVSVTSTGHIPYGINNFYVNGHWGGSVAAMAHGSGSVCCVPIPKKWYEGATVKVKWSRTAAITDIHGELIGEEIMYEYDAPLLTYQKLSDIDVHFFPDNTVKAVPVNDETFKNPPIPKPVRTANWKYMDQGVEYCKAVKLTKITYKQCLAKMQEIDDESIANGKRYEREEERIRKGFEKDPNFNQYEDPIK